MNGKRIVSAALALLLTAGIPMAALASTSLRRAA